MKQLDAVVPTQIMRYLGALKTQSGRSRFYVSFAQFAMIAVLFYNDAPAIQSTFPSVWAWGIFLAGAGGLLMVVDYLAVFPAEITYSQGQQARENRNPTYRQVMENTRRLDALLASRDDSHLREIPDGCGCSETWEHLSEQRGVADD